MADEVDVPVLTDGVVTLRGHRVDDVAAVTEMCRDPEFARWTTVPRPYEPAMAESFITEACVQGWRDQTAYTWAVDARDDTGAPRLAGNIALRAQPRPDIGFGLHPRARGRGVMSRAVRLATRWGFDTVGMPVVHWECHAGNLESWRVAWACGFKWAGEIPAFSAQRGELRDAWRAVLRPGDAAGPATRWLDVPVIEGQRVRLRPYTDTDLPRIVETCSDPVTRHWLATMSDPYTLDSARAFVLRGRLAAALGTRLGWAVAGRESDQLIADVALFRLDDEMCPGNAELGYWAHPDARGRGLVTEAVRLAVEHAFGLKAEGGLGCHRVQLGASWGNAGSRAIAERLGFTQVGHFRLDGRLGDGTYEDGAWYDLLSADPR